ncbi:hemin ABC transporter substrate-binding protein [Mesorhizobium sp. Root554]|uniref:heme/hemin ABC transporter substrate-binding protein n=1 Tax=unclassified Mesorhizobium TaxID=325217 RepID=UPI0006FC70F1|nr:MULTISPECIES: hemin ABC transporter substrate-binding protein [unclassified Mesorhizobium]KQZ13816.1 hemin ABC transporter substrate-binding protein [Mesorhizobium sp. Root1471]KQZ36328.1 hemin ABC transporter substrate-binding protein [Mesorhizobium sp. Root554]
MTYFRSLLVALAVGLYSQALPAMAADDASVFPDTSRIVSIGGAITEIVFALGEQDHLVARDSTSVYPEAAFKLPDVGYMRQLSPEGVLSVNPSGILALQGSGPKEAVDVLKKASVPFIEVPEEYDHQGILDRIRIVGKALGVDAKADALVAETDARLKAVESRVASVKQRKRILFVLSAQGGKILASGSDTAASGIISLAGGINAVEGYTGYKQLSDEAIVTAAPDVILMMRRGGPETSDAEVLGNPAIAQTPAGKAKAVIRMDGSYLLGFGPRTASAIHDLALALYGGQVAN